MYGAIVMRFWLDCGAIVMIIGLFATGFVERRKHAPKGF
jgi:hypothetical protein